MSDISDDEIENKKIIVVKTISKDDELEIINETIDRLESEIDRYMTEIRHLWDTHLETFIKSEDCLTFKYIGCYGYDKFFTLMTNQKTFKLMLISLKRLHKRKNFITKYL